LDISAHDSTTASFIYLHISNALIQSGFAEEAEVYINRSLDYNPENLYSVYVKAYILYAKEKNLKNLNMRLIRALDQDSTRLDIMQEVAKSYYFMGDYESAWYYYKRFNEIREEQNLDLYRSENAKIAFVLEEVGLTDESEFYFNDFKEYADRDISIYKHLSLAAYYSQMGEITKAMDHLKDFSKQENYSYWVILFFETDPLLDNIKHLPSFQSLLKDLESEFWKKHKRIRTSLENEGLI
jgi:tetratricopeptide (TPR) repeat protein